jgi:hypothetical protein
MSNIQIVDDFYEDPNEILDLLKNDYPITGCGSGKRSVGLQELSLAHFWKFRKAIYNMHGLDSRTVFMNTFFMQHEYKPIEVFNHNWVHIDGKNPDACRMTTADYKLVLCGQVFLTPDPDPDCDLEICRVQPELNWSRQELIDRTINDYTNPMEDLQMGRISQEEFEKVHDEYHANFVTTELVKNKFNRLVTWPAGTLHGARQNTNMPRRLTQYFFIQSTGALDTWPE